MTAVLKILPSALSNMTVMLVISKNNSLLETALVTLMSFLPIKVPIEKNQKNHKGSFGLGCHECHIQDYMPLTEKRREGKKDG